MEELKSLAEMISLKGKTTLITGASSGIGKAMAIRFAEAGSDLILLDINEEGLNKTKEDLKSFNRQVQLFKIDLSKKEEIDAVWDKFGENVPDILINNAGIYPFKDFLEVEEKFYAKVLDINLNSMFWMCQHFIKKRIEKGGTIVNIASIESVLPFKDALVHYNISKSGVLGLTRSIAREYGRKGIRANLILPGGIKTPTTDYLAKMAIRKIDLKMIKCGYDFQCRLALGRMGKPDEVATVALFLCSGLASYVQGAMIPADGGFLSS